GAGKPDPAGREDARGDDEKPDQPEECRDPGPVEEPDENPGEERSTRRARRQPAPEGHAARLDRDLRELAAGRTGGLEEAAGPARHAIRVDLQRMPAIAEALAGGAGEIEDDERPDQPETWPGLLHLEGMEGLVGQQVEPARRLGAPGPGLDVDPAQAQRERSGEGDAVAEPGQEMRQPAMEAHPAEVER